MCRTQNKIIALNIKSPNSESTSQHCSLYGAKLEFPHSWVHASHIKRESKARRPRQASAAQSFCSQVRKDPSPGASIPASPPRQDAAAARRLPGSSSACPAHARVPCPRQLCHCHAASRWRQWRSHSPTHTCPRRAEVRDTTTNYSDEPGCQHRPATKVGRVFPPGSPQSSSGSGAFQGRNWLSSTFVDSCWLTQETSDLSWSSCTLLYYNLN